MKTQDILLLGGAIVAGSYFLGKGISQLKLPSFNLDLPDLNLGNNNSGGTSFDLAGSINDLINGNYGGFSNQSTGGWINTNLKNWFYEKELQYALTPQFITLPGGLTIIDPGWAQRSTEWLAQQQGTSGGGGFR